MTTTADRPEVLTPEAPGGPGRHAPEGDHAHEIHEHHSV